MLLSFSTVSSLSSYITCETQYDLQYFSIEITDEIKNKILIKQGCRSKAVYNKSSNMKQCKSETGIKTS